MASCSPGSRGSDVWQADGAGNAGRQDRRQSASRMDTANKEVVWIRKLWRDGSSGPGWLPIDIGYGGDRIRQGNFRLATGLTSGGIRNDGMLVSCNEISGNQEARMDAMALGKWGGCAAVMAAIIVAIACSSGPKPAAPITLCNLWSHG